MSHVRSTVGVEKRHDVAASAPGAHRRAAADDLAERRNVWYDAELLLRSPRADSEALHLVEDEQYVQLGRDAPDALQERDVGGQVSKAGDHRLHDDAGQVLLIVPDDPFARFEVVEGHDQYVLGHAGRLARVFGNRRGSVWVELACGGMYADGDVLVGAVVAALEFGYLVPARERPGGAYRHQRAFGPGVREPDGVHGRHPVAKDLGQAYLGLGGPAEGRALRRLLLKGLYDLGVSVAHHEARSVDHEVEVAVAVDVVDVAAFSVVRESRVGLEEGSPPGASSRQVFGRLRLQLLGFWRVRYKPVYLTLKLFRGHDTLLRNIRCLHEQGVL